MFNHHLNENDFKKQSNQTVNNADSVFTCIMETGSTKRSKHRLHSFVIVSIGKQHLWESFK